jgi:hypothetical protein
MPKDKELFLNIWVFGHSIDHFLLVRTSHGATVEALKEEINSIFKLNKHFGAGDLTLWQAGLVLNTLTKWLIFIANQLKEPTQDLGQKDILLQLHEDISKLANYMHPCRELGGFFSSTPPKDYLHVVVKIPPSPSSM